MQRGCAGHHRSALQLDSGVSTGYHICMLFPHLCVALPGAQVLLHLFALHISPPPGIADAEHTHLNDLQSASCRWVLGGGITALPLVAVAGAHVLGWRWPGVLHEDAVAHLVIAWALGLLMGFLAETYRR